MIGPCTCHNVREAPEVPTNCSGIPVFIFAVFHALILASTETLAPAQVLAPV